jgi:WD40 repeat protein
VSVTDLELKSSFEVRHHLQLTTRGHGQVSDPEMDCGITTAAFHPDGVILGTGCQDTMVRVWEVRQQKVRERQLSV